MALLWACSNRPLRERSSVKSARSAMNGGLNEDTPCSRAAPVHPDQVLESEDGENIDDDILASETRFVCSMFPRSVLLGTLMVFVMSMMRLACMLNYLENCTIMTGSRSITARKATYPSSHGGFRQFKPSNTALDSLKLRSIHNDQHRYPQRHTTGSELLVYAIP